MRVPGLPALAPPLSVCYRTAPACRGADPHALAPLYTARGYIIAPRRARLHTRARAFIYAGAMHVYASGNISLYNISMQFFRTCALLVPAFSAILCSFSAYPRGRFACMLSVFSALYRAIARRWAALVLLSCSCIIIHHDTIVYPWLYIHGYISTLHRYILSFFKLRFLCMVYPWIARYTIGTTTEQPTAPRPRHHVVTP